jgi:hypothetical protein
VPVAKNDERIDDVGARMTTTRGSSRRWVLGLRRRNQPSRMVIGFSGCFLQMGPQPQGWGSWTIPGKAWTIKSSAFIDFPKNVGSTSDETGFMYSELADLIQNESYECSF